MSEETNRPAEPADAPEPSSRQPTSRQPTSRQPTSRQPTSQPPTSSSASTWQPSYVFLAVLTIINLVADLASKQWIKRYFESAPQLRVSRKIEVIKGYMNLIYATNKGGAWGILQGEHESLRRPFFLVVSVAAIVFIISLYRKLTPGQHALKWGLPLVLGGALGNLFDRIVYGWVIDFIDVYTKVGGEEKHWPTFNVADVSICVGVGLMAIDMFTSREKKGDAPSSARNPQPVSGGLTPASAADLGAGLGPRPPREPGSEPPSSNSAKD